MRLRDFRRTARRSLKGNWFVAFVAGLIASVFGVGGGFSVSFSVPVDSESSELFDIIASQMGAAELNVLVATFGAVAAFVSVFGVAFLIAGIAVGIGYAQFNLDIIDHGEGHIGTLFSRFGQLKTAFFAHLFIAIRVWFSYLLFIIPGIIATYNYVIVNHVMADNPGMNAREVVRECKRIMKGNRFKFFCLGLSFIPHVIFGALTLGIAYIWIIPHMQASVAAFYREIAN